jgi:hypothetical protein
LRQLRPAGLPGGDARAGKGADAQAGGIVHLDAGNPQAGRGIDHRIDQPHPALKAGGGANRCDIGEHAGLEPGDILLGHLCAHFQPAAFGEAEQGARTGADHLPGFDRA